MDGGRRVYSEQEASEILQRAVLLAEQSKGGYTPGVTADELRRIAAEAGLPPEALEAALLEHGAPVPEKRAFGGAVERVIDGELSPDDFDLVMEGLRPVGQHGRHAGIVQVGRSLKANVFHRGHIMEVNLSSRNGRTRVTVKPNLFMGIFLPLYFGLFFAGFGLAVGREAAGVGMGIAVALLSATIGTLIAGIMLRTARPHAEALAAELTTRVAENIQAAPATVTGTVEESLEQRLHNKG